MDGFNMDDSKTLSLSQTDLSRNSETWKDEDDHDLLGVATSKPVLTDKNENDDPNAGGFGLERKIFDAFFEETLNTSSGATASKTTIEEVLRRNNTKFLYHNAKTTSIARIKRCWCRLSTHWRNSRAAVVWAVLYIVANAVAFSLKAHHYHINRQDATDVFGCCILVARGAASALNLNCALILLPTCTNALAKLRRCRPLASLFPLDSTATIHRVIGCMIVFWTMVHVFSHVGDFYNFSIADEQDIVTLLNGRLGIDHVEDVPASAFDRWKLLLQTPAAITGVLMCGCMTIAYACVILQASLDYNIFWYSHHLLIVMLVILLFHGMGSLLEPFESIYWVGFPLLLYLIPRLWRESVFNKAVPLLELRIKEGGKLMVLRVSKPKSWSDGEKLLAGMYVNINIPEISRFEWHPFSITSAPSDNFLEFHICNAGDWTDQLFKIAQQNIVQYSCGDPSITGPFSIEAASSESGFPQAHDSLWLSSAIAQIPSKRLNHLPHIYLEGPMGASCQGFSDHRILVLCGAGVGATPMVSVVKELLRNRGKMKRTYFFWTFRDIEALEWFSAMLDDIFMENADILVPNQELFKMRLFLTSQKKTSGRSFFIHHSRSSRHLLVDDINVLQVNPNFEVNYGRPNWFQELSQVRDQSKQLGLRTAGVFVCGPQEMAQDVQRNTVRVSKRDPGFHFYCRRENFCRVGYRTKASCLVQTFGPSTE